MAVGRKRLHLADEVVINEVPDLAVGEAGKAPILRAIFLSL